MKYQILTTSEPKISLFIINKTCYWFETEDKRELIEFMEIDYTDSLPMEILEHDLKVFINRALQTAII